MKFISAQPATDYYTWQVEVMINNFIKNGVNPNDIHVVCGYAKTIPENWRKLAAHYNKVKFFFYPDERFKPSYISSIRPHVLHEHWLRNPQLENEVIFYHDSDILFTNGIEKFEGLAQDDICYVSDTVSYIGANYIKSKGEHYLELMSRLVNVNKLFIMGNEKDSGGAQYILKNIKAEFWKKVYYDCENLWRMVNAEIVKDNPPHPIQIWCADMWAVLWNLWFFDKKVKVSEDMSFSWATSRIEDWDKHPIYHNAGVTNPNEKMFYKAVYQTILPYDISLESFTDKRCSYKYAEEIVSTKEVSCLK